MDIFQAWNEHHNVTSATDDYSVTARAGLDPLLDAIMDAMVRHNAVSDYVGGWTRLDSGDVAIQIVAVMPDNHEVVPVAIVCDGRFSTLYTDDEVTALGFHPYEVCLPEDNLPVWDGPADIDPEVENVMANRHIFQPGDNDPKHCAEFILAMIALRSDTFDMIDHEYPEV